MSQETRKGFHQPAGNGFIPVGVIAPRWNLFRTLCEQSFWRNYAGLQLPRINFLAQCVPTTIKVAFEFINPLFTHMVRAVHCACCHIGEKWLLRLRTFLHLHPRNCLINNVFGHVVVITTFIWHHRRGLVEQWRLPLRCLGIDNSVKAFKTHTCWPSVEGACQCLFPHRGEMPLSKTRCGVTRETQNFRNRRSLFGYDTVVTRKHIRCFRNSTHMHGVVITPRQHCCSRGRTQGGGMKLVVAQAVLRYSV